MYTYMKYPQFDNELHMLQKEGRGTTILFVNAISAKCSINLHKTICKICVFHGHNEIVQ